MDEPTITGRYRHDIPNGIDRLRREPPARIELNFIDLDLASIELRALAFYLQIKGGSPDGLALRS
jgi:hypothetical protein